MGKVKPRLKTGQVAETRKRELKRSEGLIEKGIDVPSYLLEGLTSDQRSKLEDMFESRVTHRDLMSAAISSYLPQIVGTLLQLGIRKTPKGNQRPRKFDVLAWKSLEAAESVTGLPKVVLLRACLSLLDERGATQVDVKACLDEISEMDLQRKRGSSDE